MNPFMHTALSSPLKPDNHNFRRVNDAFTMYIVRLLESDTARRFSDEAMNLIAKYGAFFIQFRRFSYIRLAGYENTPLKLPMFCNDKMALIEVCRKLDKLHRTCRDKKISGLHFPISLGNYTCKTALDAQNIERALAPITVHFFRPKTYFDLKKFIELNLRINYHHRSDTEDYWANCANEFEARTKVWFDRKVRELKKNLSESSSKDTSTPRKESHTPSSEVPVQTPPPPSNKEPESSTPSSSTQVYQKKVKEVKQEPIEEDPLLKHSELPSGLENVIFLSESDDSEVPIPARTSEVAIDKEKEVHSNEPPSYH
ncbi:hypothetical protein KI387_043876 [Taxus chinensis]|uniref:Uncharacterized protein n=1 Tax=Taxus chinensis TaxID=29808 RepID=A0AA38CWG8_TAXCH|nr:hypothetical protein KI387_043876 [Taxus chinensis]